MNYRITTKDVTRLKWALGLSIAFIFFNIHLSLGFWPLSVSSLIVALVLQSIHPISEEDLKPHSERVINPNGIQDFEDWLNQDRAREYLSKADQKRAFNDQRYTS